MSTFFSKVISFVIAVIMFLPNTVMGWVGYARVNIDFDNVIGEMRPVNGTSMLPLTGAKFNVDSVDPELYELYAEANFPYSRTHDLRYTDVRNIFPDFSRDPEDETAYDFRECDAFITALEKIGIEPYFRLGISWIYNPVKEYYEGLPPEDYHKWAKICEQIIRHYNYGWANGFEYNIEYWEIWNEPDNDDDLSKNHFWMGTPEEFYELYDVTAKHLKNTFPEIKVGGYASCGFYALTKSYVPAAGSSPRNKYFIEFFDGFIDYIKKHDSPLDFFSWHSYDSVERNELYIKYARKRLDKAGYKNAESHCTEWNAYSAKTDSEYNVQYGAKQAAMLMMFQNKGLDLATYYRGAAANNELEGMFRNGEVAPAYYSFWAFGQLYAMKNQVKISGSMPKDMYAVAAADGENAGLLLANISEKKDRKININADGYEIDKCMTVNENGEWVQTQLPKKIPSGSILYITFKK